MHEFMISAWNRLSLLPACWTVNANLHMPCRAPAILLQHWRTEGGLGVKPPKFRSFDQAEPNSQFRGKYIRNNPFTN
jgi:hypothetical protein